MRTLRWVAVLALFLALTGCIKLDQELTLSQDGSGTLDMRYGMSEQTIAQLEAMQQMGQSMGGDAAMESDTPFDFDFDEAAVRDEFEAKNIEGVKLMSASAETVDGWRFMNLKIAFDNLEALRKTEYFEDSDMSLTKDAEGNYVLVQRSGDADAPMGDVGGDGESALEAPMMQQMAAMFAGLRIATRVSVPTEIIETNATKVDGKTASWIFDIDEDPNVLSKLENLDLRVVFKSDGLSLPEIGGS